MSDIQGRFRIDETTVFRHQGKVTLLLANLIAMVLQSSTEALSLVKGREMQGPRCIIK